MSHRMATTSSPTTARPSMPPPLQPAAPQAPPMPPPAPPSPRGEALRSSLLKKPLDASSFGRRRRDAGLSAAVPVRRTSLSDVIAGHDPAIHDEAPQNGPYVRRPLRVIASWMPGTSPGMTPNLGSRGVKTMCRLLPPHQIDQRRRAGVAGAFIDDAVVFVDFERSEIAEGGLQQFARIEMLPARDGPPVLYSSCFRP